MTRALLTILLLFWAVSATAQTEPRLTLSLEEDSVIVGQPLVLRIQVLVPTFLPKPPVFPSFEVPGLMVRLPERASGPVSERIDGETWAGVQRAYRLYPLQVGDFELPSQPVLVTYADPDGGDPIEVSLPLDPISFSATIPAEAGNLNPPILAEDFKLEQVLDAPETLQVGDAVTRTITASISGTTAVLIPALMPDVSTDALRAYPDEPSVSEVSERGVLSGTRTEKTTYVAQADGTATLPDLALDWFNVSTGKVETATLPGASFAVEGAAAAAIGRDTMATLRATWPLILLGIVAFFLVWRYRGWAAEQFETARDRWEASEPYAYREVRRALRKRHLLDSVNALEHWSSFFPQLTHDRLAPVRAPLDLTWHSAGTKAAADDLWRRAETAYRALRKTLKTDARLRESAGHLPTLNNH